MSEQEIKNIIEAALFTSETPLNLKKMKTFLGGKRISNQALLDIVKSLQADYEDRGVELIQVATGYRFQAPQKYGEILLEAQQEKAPKYSRAVLETLALIAYRQPITRAEIEDIRGVAVSSNIIKMLSEREWIKVVGHKEVPGKPAMYATTNQFLDYFNLTTLDQLPELLPINETSLDIDDVKTIESATSDGAH